jgi:hypothetical protein
MHIDPRIFGLAAGGEGGRVCGMKELGAKIFLGDS